MRALSDAVWTVSLAWFCENLDLVAEVGENLDLVAEPLIYFCYISKIS